MPAASIQPASPDQDELHRYSVHNPPIHEEPDEYDSDDEHVPEQTGNAEEAEDDSEEDEPMQGGNEGGADDEEDIEEIPRDDAELADEGVFGFDELAKKHDDTRFEELSDEDAPEETSPTTSQPPSPPLTAIHAPEDSPFTQPSPNVARFPQSAPAASEKLVDVSTPKEPHHVHFTGTSQADAHEQVPAFHDFLLPSEQAPVTSASKPAGGEASSESPSAETEEMQDDINHDIARDEGARSSQGGQNVGPMLDSTVAAFEERGAPRTMAGLSATPFTTPAPPSATAYMPNSPYVVPNSPYAAPGPALTAPYYDPRSAAMPAATAQPPYMPAPAQPYTPAGYPYGYATYSGYPSYAPTVPPMQPSPGYPQPGPYAQPATTSARLPTQQPSRQDHHMHHLSANPRHQPGMHIPSLASYGGQNINAAPSHNVPPNLWRKLAHRVWAYQPLSRWTPGALDRAMDSPNQAMNDNVYLGYATMDAHLTWTEWQDATEELLDALGQINPTVASIFNEHFQHVRVRYSPLWWPTLRTYDIRTRLLHLGDTTQDLQEFDNRLFAAILIETSDPTLHATEHVHVAQPARRAGGPRHTARTAHRLARQPAPPESPYSPSSVETLPTPFAADCAEPTVATHGRADPGLRSGPPPSQEGDVMSAFLNDLYAGLGDSQVVTALKKAGVTAPTQLTELTYLGDTALEDLLWSASRDGSITDFQRVVLLNAAKRRFQPAGHQTAAAHVQSPAYGMAI